jgi:hypothetical protein
MLSDWSDRDALSGAGVGLLTGQLGAITVVDLDDASLLPLVLDALGNTPITVETPSGGFHLWYRFSGEACQDLRPDLKIDVKGRGGFVAAPPTVRAVGNHAGRAYRFQTGGLADMGRLPAIPAGALERLAKASRSKPSPCKSSTAKLPEGTRNRGLLRAALQLAHGATDADDHRNTVVLHNADHCQPPLSDKEAKRVAASAWRYHVEGRNWAGTGAVAMSRTTSAILGNPDAFWLLHHLRLNHAACGGEFAIAARAMEQSGVAAPLTERQIRRATQRLVETGFLIRTHIGGRGGPGDPSLYRLGRDPASA